VTRSPVDDSTTELRVVWAAIERDAVLYMAHSPVDDSTTELRVVCAAIEKGSVLYVARSSVESTCDRIASRMGSY